MAQMAKRSRHLPLFLIPLACILLLLAVFILRADRPQLPSNGLENPANQEVENDVVPAEQPDKQQAQENRDEGIAPAFGAALTISFAEIEEAPKRRTQFKHGLKPVSDIISTSPNAPSESDPLSARSPEAGLPASARRVVKSAEDGYLKQVMVHI